MSALTQACRIRNKAVKLYYGRTIHEDELWIATERAVEEALGRAVQCGEKLEVAPGVFIEAEYMSGPRKEVKAHIEGFVAAWWDNTHVSTEDEELALLEHIELGLEKLDRVIA